MSKNKKNKKQIIVTQTKQEQTTAIPYIIGGEFDFSNDLAKYQQMIATAPKTDRKKRILFVSEASYLRTGFATYLHEVFTRLLKTGKYELAEFGSYGEHPNMEPAAKAIPWKYYHNLPTNPIEEQEYGFVDGRPVHEGYKDNQFGKWKFDRIVADFKPDIVISIRDWWMDTYIKESIFRDKFTWFWMPTVDGYPQRWQWLTDYNGVDKIFTYSHFGKKVLETQSSTVMAKLSHINPIKVVDVCQPGADPNVFKPMNKVEVKKIFGIPDKFRFVGTVMRNQPRKLFPRIIESFAKFRKEHQDIAQNVYLLLHTSIPDVGWDIPGITVQHGIQEFVTYTYLCVNCHNIAVSNFRGSPIDCPTCNARGTFMTPNTKYGVEPEHLNLIYNLMDVYIQGSIAEGDGMPVTEARMAGVPCLVSDYSALYEKARNGGALPILNETLYTEHETHQWRSLFDRKDMVKKLAMLLGSSARLQHFSQEARECSEKYYTWELCAKKWEAYIDTTEVKNRATTWDSPIGPDKVPTIGTAPTHLTDPEYVEWCYINILCRKGADPEGLHHWCAALTQGMTREQLEEHFRKIVAFENSKKELLQNPERVNKTLYEVICDTVKETEGKDAL